MDIARINVLLNDSLGEADENQQPVEGSEVFNFFLVKIALKTNKVHEHAAEMIELLKGWPSESYGRSVPRLGEEINYITAGRILGDQTMAFMLFAFGKTLDWWYILDPFTMLGLEYDNPQGIQLALKGKVAVMGYQPAGIPA
ncbi:MAG: hypothetical protein ABIQ04_00360 [Candidatus Saccharimonadales bacterium]